MRNLISGLKAEATSIMPEPPNLTAISIDSAKNNVIGFEK